jgi:hypothetical protein
VLEWSKRIWIDERADGDVGWRERERMDQMMRVVLVSGWSVDFRVLCAPARMRGFRSPAGEFVLMAMALAAAS